VSCGPHFSQKGKVKAKKISLRGPDVARGPYVAPSWSSNLERNENITFYLIKLLMVQFLSFLIEDNLCPDVMSPFEIPDIGV